MARKPTKVEFWGGCVSGCMFLQMLCILFLFPKSYRCRMQKSAIMHQLIIIIVYSIINCVLGWKVKKIYDEGDRTRAKKWLGWMFVGSLLFFALQYIMYLMEFMHYMTYKSAAQNKDSDTDDWAIFWAVTLLFYEIIVF